jgi:O-antigen ligase
MMLVVAAVWLAGALAGEGLALAGAGLTAAVLLIKRAPRPPLLAFAAVALYAAWCLLTSVWAPRPLHNGAPFSALHVLLFPLALWAWRALGVKERGVLTIVFAITAALSAIVALLQYFALIPDLHLDARWVPTFRMNELAEPGRFKAGGLFFHRLKFAHTLVPLAFAFMPRMWARSRVVALALALLLALALAATFTHASWLALAVGVTLALVWRRAPWLALLLFVLPLLLAAFTTVPTDRQVAWHEALTLWRAHPIAGVGFGGYTNAALAQFGVNAEFPLIHLDAHCLILQVLAETGAVGLALFALAAWAMARVLGRFSPRQAGVLGAALTLGIVHNLFFHPVVILAVALALAAEPDDTP